MKYFFSLFKIQMMLREFEDKENQMAELDEQVRIFWRVKFWMGSSTNDVTR